MHSAAIWCFFANYIHLRFLTWWSDHRKAVYLTAGALLLIAYLAVTAASLKLASCASEAEHDQTRLEVMASVQTTFWLLALATLFFVIGSVYFRFEKQFLPQLNFHLVQDWMRENRAGSTRGYPGGFSCCSFCCCSWGSIRSPAASTACCGCCRCVKRWFGLEFAVTLTPTLIHLVFILVLCGHLLSSFAGSVEKVSCASGKTIALSGQRSLQVLAVRYETRTQPASLAGKLIRMSADLRFRSPGFDGKFTTAILSPAHRAGYSFHLDSIDKYARTRELILIIRRDPGIRLIIPGLLFIITAHAWYFPALWVLKNKLNSKEN